MKRVALAMMLTLGYATSAMAQDIDIYTAMTAASSCIDKRFFDAGYYDDDPERLALINRYLGDVGVKVPFVQKEYDAMADQYAGQTINQERFKYYYSRCPTFRR